jgi:hypothetical protein
MQGAAVLLAASLAAAQALAAPPKPAAPSANGLSAPADVDTAEALYAKLDYDGANSVAERVVKQRGLSHDQLVRAYRVLAVTYAVLDKDDDAQKAFFQLLVYDPDYQVDPNLGPKVTQPFMNARGTFRVLPSKPGLEVSAAVQTTGGTLKVTTRDPTKIVKKVVVGYRWTSSGDYTTAQLSSGEGNVEIGAAPGGRTRLDFYAQALDDHDNAVLEAGSPQVPKSAFAEAGSRGGGGGGKKDEGGSIFASPIFWIVAGAAVVGGGTALFFAVRPQDPPTKASLAPVIQCGTDRCN